MNRSLRSWLWRVPLDQEVDEELALHVELRTRELVERGLTPKAARDIVLSRIGDLGHLKRTCVDLGRKRDREMRVTQWLDERRHDVRFALRQLKSSPAFTVVAALTLALGIGANSAIFALADATLIRPLPYPQPDRLVMIWSRHPTVPRAGVSPLDLRDFEKQTRTLETLAAVAFGAGGGPLVEAPDGSLQSADRQSVTARFFDVLGVAPVAGRTFLPSDAEQGAAPVIVMGEGLWRRRFSGDPSLVGRQVRLNGSPFTVIGIVGDDVQLQRPAEVWGVIRPPENMPRAFRFLQTIGRMKPGVTLDAAQADLAVISSRLAQTYPESNKDWSVRVEPLRTGVMSATLQTTSLFLLGVVGFVLLLCCANVANLLLARGNARARELAVRAALGAGRSRIASQLLTESIVLAALGGVLGVGIGATILNVAPLLIPAGLLPAAATFTFDSRVAIFCAVAALSVGVLFGLVPAWQATRTSLVQAISSESRSSTSRGGRLRHVLVAGEVAAAVVLLCGAGLLLRTLLVLDNVDTGYRADGDSVLTLDFSVQGPRPGTRYPDLPSLMQFYDAASREIGTIPGVRNFGWSTGLPYGTTSEIGRLPMEIVGDPPLAPDDRPRADIQAADPGYFATIDLPIVTGRGFSDRDTHNSQMVSIVNEAFVRRYLGGRDPIGMRIRTMALGELVPPTEREIVGVARQLLDQQDAPEPPAQMFVPLAQLPWADTYLAVQASDGPVRSLIAPIREAVARVDRDVPVRRERTLTDLAHLNTAPHRFRAAIVGTFATLALVLAMVGIFGVLAYSVEQRRREIGVRIALGATAASLLRLVMGGATRVVAIGGVIGLAAAALIARTLSTFLFGVEPFDPMTFGVVGLILALTATIATAAPAWRATRVDPVEAFRAE
ncbi:MAG TPA: ABC transporter permease [Vicinamibacterales bacterium]|nr:ABC transporter permease [Vicinamibacterales bacterium]